MFSANENITLRQDKRRIIGYVEECIPEDALDMGTSVMVMQVSCRAPGCVPLETLVCIVFPKMGHELIAGLKESAGGTFKTKTLMPMAQVTKQDVLESLPPEFPGGQRSIAKLCIKVRDVTLSQIEQIMGDGDTQGKQLMAEYLQECLKTYIAHGCVAPEWGEEYAPETTQAEDNTDVNDDSRRNGDLEQTLTNGVATVTDNKKKTFPSGNFVVRRVLDDDDDDASPTDTIKTKSGTLPTATDSVTSTVSAKTDNNKKKAPTETATDWRRRTNMEQQVSASLSSQQSIISRLAEREHEPGVRRPGCPCCDPDSATNYVDNMMML